MFFGASITGESGFPRGLVRFRRVPAELESRSTVLDPRGKPSETSRSSRLPDPFRTVPSRKRCRYHPTLPPTRTSQTHQSFGSDVPEGGSQQSRSPLEPWPRPLRGGRSDLVVLVRSDRGFGQVPSPCPTGVIGVSPSHCYHWRKTRQGTWSLSRTLTKVGGLRSGPPSPTAPRVRRPPLYPGCLFLL